MRTACYWLQTAHWYADIRIPPGPGRSQAFAGWLRLRGRQCRWVRHYELGPPVLAPDVGRLDRRGRRRMYERGADYREVWQRLDDGRGDVVAMRLRETCEAGAERGILVIIGDRFVCLRGIARRTGAGLRPGRAATGRRRAGGLMIERASDKMLVGAPLFPRGSLSRASIGVIREVTPASASTWDVLESTVASDRLPDVLTP